MRTTKFRRLVIGIATAAIHFIGEPSAGAQHSGHEHETRPAENPAEAAPMENETSAADHDEMSKQDSAMKTPLGIPDTRDASGTAWQPESTPMFMWHWMSHGWSFGLHTNVFAGFDNANDRRGDNEPLSINWIMGMARRPIGDGDLMVRAMLSLEPLTVGKDGYPLLLQTGEAVNGMPLHDRQHPHDLFMELAARYRNPLTDSLAFELYVAPSGEPALGPPAFPHRFTAMPNPLAPLGHHWQDSTHISFGVLTAGLFTRLFKLEGSWFNGREPDEDRYDIDLRVPDSYSARLTVNPNADVSAQVSWGWLDSPELLEPGVDLQRLTASLMWNRGLGDGNDVAVTAVFGRNDPSMGPSTNAGLAEGTLMVRNNHTVFSRVELLEKTGHDLALPEDMEDDTFGMATFSAGYVYEAGWISQVVPGIGFVATVNAIGSDLEPFYGTRAPWGAMVFVRLRPPTMSEHGSITMH